MTEKIDIFILRKITYKNIFIYYLSFMLKYNILNTDGRIIKIV